MSPGPSFEALLAEGEAAPVTGWDFSWFAGRASEERPSWGYAGMLAARLAAARAALDLETGGGEVLASVLAGATGLPAGTCCATDGWPPNAAVAARRLATFGVPVVCVADAAGLPFCDRSFDLVSARHPVSNNWQEIARVLAPGGAYLSQQVGPGSNRELYEYLMGPQRTNEARGPDSLVAGATSAGLVVTDLRDEWLHVEFADVAAIVVFLRTVIWTVPGFTVAAYRGRLEALHEQIVRDGRFVCRSRRVLIEAHRRG